MLTILQGDSAEKLRELPDESVHCCVTSPPYYGLRDYQVDGQIGWEKSPEEYVAKMVAVFSEVKRVLRSDGTLWLNLGDSYYGGGRGGNPDESPYRKQSTNAGSLVKPSPIPNGLKSKDLVGIPWMVAFALRSDGWYLRSEIPWIKRNCMPESVTDRPVKSLENMFLLAKSTAYFFDMESIKVPASDAYVNDSRWESGPTDRNIKDGYELAGTRNPKDTHAVFNGEKRTTRNRRNGDWWMESYQGLYNDGENLLGILANPCGYKEAHFATFPPELIKPCIMAGCPVGGTVLDPFGGSGTTGQVAIELGRSAILIELNPDYIKLIQTRTNVTPGLPL